MQVELPMKCGCGKEGKKSIRVDASSFEWVCPACENSIYVVLDLDLTIGFLLLERSRYDFRKRTTILFRSPWQHLPSRMSSRVCL
jgi:hypothetical protein